MKFKLDYCHYCNQMTNHFIKDGVSLCAKCGKKDILAGAKDLFDFITKKKGSK